MACEKCENTVGCSYSGKPFVPPRGSCNQIEYVCSCGQIWFQMNTHFHLWQKETPESMAAWRRELSNPEPDW